VRVNVSASGVAGLGRERARRVGALLRVAGLRGVRAARRVGTTSLRRVRAAGRVGATSVLLRVAGLLRREATRGVGALLGWVGARRVGATALLGWVGAGRVGSRCVTVRLRHVCYGVGGSGK
jgi:hypothetical protein